MLDQKKLIEEINKTCKVFFTESTFHLSPSTTNRFNIKGSNPSKAINNYNNTAEEVDVIKWFNGFWVYIDIRFENTNTFISISIFQGETSENRKHQLFRAEWDDYNNEEEKHPQPHWHVTANQAIEKTFEEYTTTFKEDDGFVKALEAEKSKIIDMNRIHFAMNGNWINNGSETHSLNDEEKIVNWFKGLLSHIKTQLEYVS